MNEARRDRHRRRLRAGTANRLRAGTENRLRAGTESRRDTLLLVATIVLLAVALAAGAATFVVRSDTSDLQARTDPINRRVRQLTADELNSERRLRAVRTRSTGLATRLAELLRAFQAQVDASNHAVDVANQAVDQYNTGQAGVAAAFQAAGDAATADLEQKTAAVTAAVAAVQREITALGQVSGG
jgi:hypothetical protein